MNRKHSFTRTQIAIGLVVALFAGLVFGRTTLTTRRVIPPLLPPNGGSLVPQGRTPNAAFTPFYSVTDDLPCVDTTPITGDNQTKAKTAWYAAGGGLTDSLARAGQTNANTDDENLVYETSRTQHGLIVMAISCGDDALLQSIGESWTNVLNSRVTYSPALGGRPGANFSTWLIYNTAASPPYGGVLNIAYMYTMVWNMATILAYIARIAPASRTAWQSAFVTRWAGPIKEQYNHLMYEVNWPSTGDACDGPFSYGTYGTSISGKEQQVARFAVQNWGSAVQDKPGCNRIRDAEQFIHAGFAEFLRAHLADPTNIPITGSLMTATSMKKIVSLMNLFFQNNSQATSLTNFAGVAVTGRYIEPASYWFRPNPNVPGTYWGLATENAWAADTDSSRSPADPPCSPGRAAAPSPFPVGLDSSHANLDFYILLSHRALNNVAGITDPIPTSFMAQMANQVAYGVGNKDLTYPRFRNFTSGANGWYRAVYGSRAGYPPWEAGTRGVQTGTYMWATYNADIATYATRWKQIWEAQPGSADYTWRVANLGPDGGKWNTGCTFDASATLNVSLSNPYSSQMFYPSMAKFVGDGSSTGPTTTTIAPTTTTIAPATNDACPAARTCVFSANPAPTAVAGGNGTPIQTGFKVSSSVDGQITTVRYYRYGGDLSTRTIRIYGPTGTLLTSTSTSVATEGWRNVTLPAPLNITAGTLYTVTVDSSTGIYPYTYNVFSSAVTSGVLTAPATGTTPNGVYGAGGATVPAFTFQATSYGVDVGFIAGVVPPVTTTTTIVSETTTTFNTAPRRGCRRVIVRGVVVCR